MNDSKDEAKKTSGRKRQQRMYIEERNKCLVGLCDLPSHMKIGTSVAQLSPIFSIFTSNIEDAFIAQATGKVSSYMSLIELKPKSPQSMLDTRTSTDEEAFGWIDDISLLEQLPREFNVLKSGLDERYSNFLSKFVSERLERLQDNIEISKALDIPLPKLNK